MRGLVLVLVGIAGCADYDSTWQIRIGVPRQSLTRADVAIADQVAVGPGDAWIAIRAYDSTDVVYPIADDGAALVLESPFDPTRADPHAALLTMTRLSRDSEPAEKHPSHQYATIMVDAIVSPTVRDAIAAGMVQQLTLELEIPTAGTCTPPAVMVAGKVSGCLAGGPTCDGGPLARRDGLYQAGPVGLSIEVLDQQCAE